MLPPPWLLAAGLVIGLLVLLPARRLQLGGTSSQWIAIYAVCVWALAFLLVVRPFAARFLVPILIVLYVAPFVAAPDRIRALVRREPGGRGGRGGPPQPPMKNVTPPDDSTPPG
ncbi:MAG: hypothetical protein ACJ77U_05485 [Chloroflexota bacterium]